VTEAVLRALRSGQTRFEGNHSCQGRLGEAECGRMLHYVGIATYR
jgi:hypothetical protein